MQQSATKMPFGAMHRAEDMAAPPLLSSPEPNGQCDPGAHVYERGAADEVQRRSLRQGVREHLFHKALTPSDVGNLNRLVVPKQHAEKHFLVKRSPFMAAGMGVLLGFEDGEGKTWRFRYSYCRSSRIYILTKGWRRFVREKELQAGDTVVFSLSAVRPFKKLHIDYWKLQKKPQEDAAAARRCGCHWFPCCQAVWR